jgi:hypothetical protein
VKSYALYFNIHPNTIVVWELWTTGSKDDKRVMKGADATIAEAMERAGQWVAKHRG